MSWKNIVNLSKLEFVAEQPVPECYEYTTAPAAISDKMGAKKIGYNVSTVPPGKFSCPYHFHHSEEELFLVLEGKAMLRQGDQFREVSKGDLIFFESGPEGAHQFYNHTDQTFIFFALSTRDELDVCEYPDSKKVLVKKIRTLFQSGTKVDYWEGEKDPAQFWPKKHLRE
jgi:uncharacterized cupin superfamily protein